MNANKTVFFDHLRNAVRLCGIDKLLRHFTGGKGYGDFFVKSIPQNFQYPAGTLRTARLEGVKFELDLSEYMEWVIYFGLDVECRRPLYDKIRPGMIVLDVGSNIGETLLHFAKIVGPQGFVYGFEPVSETFEKCRKNISLNPFSNLMLLQTALSDVEEELFYDARTFNNSGGISMSKIQHAGSNMTTSCKLDSFISKQNVGQVDFIKIDVEGFETNILKGAKETCLRLKPLLYVEVDDANLKSKGSSADELLHLIESYGYRIQEKIRNPYAIDQDAHYEVFAVPSVVS